MAILADLSQLAPNAAREVHFGHVATALTLRGWSCTQFAGSYFYVEISALFDKALTLAHPSRREFVTAELAVDYGLLWPLLQTQRGPWEDQAANASAGCASLYAAVVFLAAAGMHEELGVLLAKHEAELLNCQTASAAFLLAAQLASIRGHNSVMGLLGSAAACTSHPAWNGFHRTTCGHLDTSDGLFPSPLMLAVSSNSAECVRLVLAAGADDKAAAATGTAAVHKSGRHKGGKKKPASSGELLWRLIQAAMLGDVHVLRVLVQAGAAHLESMIAATHFAAINGHPEAVAFLMSVLPVAARKRWLGSGTGSGGVVTRDLAIELNFVECAAAIRHP